MNGFQKERRTFRHPPMTKRELEWRGWNECDVILITGDAFIDHPSFEIAILGRVLETLGLKVGFIAQPDWNDLREFTQLGKPRLFFVVSAGKNDSMIANYRPTKRPRKIDFFSPGRLPGLRPDRASQVYTEICKKVYPEVPVVLTGHEATMRRFAHYDFWDDKLRPGLLAETEADLLTYGYAERSLTQIARVFARGGNALDCRTIRGVMYKVDRNQEGWEQYIPPEHVKLPNWDELLSSKTSFLEHYRLVNDNVDYFRKPQPLVENYNGYSLVQTPPQRPLSTTELDRMYELPYSRTPHPKYREAGPIPSFETVKYGITTHRGCFGDCTFCGNHLFEGRYISQRSKDSIIREATLIAGLRYFRGWISNVGGPMANMYGMGCTLPEEQRAECQRTSCIHPAPCKDLKIDHSEYLDLLKSVRCVDGVERCYLSSNLRVDIIERDPHADEFLEEVMRYFLPGHLKVPFEHVSDEVNKRLHKYDENCVENFIKRFQKLSKLPGLEELYVTPYFVSAHPGSRLEDAIEVALFLKRNNLENCQIQDFVPVPGSASSVMYYTGIDPYNEETVYRPLAYRERKLQRSLFQYYKPQNERYVFDALKEADRLDLVGEGDGCLIGKEPAWSPFE
ncbi:MAG TPA: YgiQ family radical SAM protein [bacterium]|nr:YgiQ family radical SAM protein [bacterium]